MTAICRQPDNTTDIYSCVFVDIQRFVLIADNRLAHLSVLGVLSAALIKKRSRLNQFIY